MKRLFVSIIILFPLLSACNGSDKSDGVACELQYWDGTFGTCLPADWVAVNKETLRQRGVPEETFVAFQSDVASSGQFPTVSITRESLAEVLTPENYSNASIRSVTTLPEYTELDISDTQIDSEKVKMHVFSLKPIADEPVRRFYQISTTVGNVGFTITGTSPLSPTEKVDEEIKLILGEATFMAKEEE